MVRTLLPARPAVAGGEGGGWINIFGRTASEESPTRRLALFGASGKRKLRERSTSGSSGEALSCPEPVQGPRFDEGLGVGLATKEYQRPVRDCKPKRSTQVDRQIMHRFVNADLMVYVVKKDATPEDIGTAFELPPEYVQSRWYSDDEHRTTSASKRSLSERHKHLSKPCDAGALEDALRQVLRKMCGFSCIRTHPELAIAGSNRMISKTGHGLYRTAFSARSVTFQERRPHYFEIVLLDKDVNNEACIGVVAGAPSQFAHRLIGTRGNSVALFTGGEIVQDNVWAPVGTACKEGDVVSCLLIPQDADGGCHLHIYFYVNAVPVSETPHLLWLPDGESLHAGVSLYQNNITAMLRCCPDELILHEAVPSDALTLCRCPVHGDGFLQDE